MIKSELRKAYLERRRSLSPEAHSALSVAILERLFTSVDFSSIRAIHSYLSVRHLGEVDTSKVFSRIWHTHPNIITTAPRMNGENGEIESLIYQPDTATQENSWKIPEPAGSEMVSPEALDLVIVPLLCFDGRGHRVGYGRGYYDRFLQKCRPDCIKAGLSFFPPVDLIDDVHDLDVPLDLCVTPDDTVRFP